MRLIVAVSLILFAVGWLASEIRLSGPQPEGRTDSGWRRTRHGWENVGGWTPPPRPHQPRLQPLVVALLELLLSAAALVAFSRPTGRRPAAAGIGRLGGP